MKVTISVFGRFWAFYTANQLNNRGHLRKLITSYPAYEAGKYGVPEEKVKSLPHYEVADRGWGKLSKWIPINTRDNIFIKNGYGWSASCHIPQDTDIFVGYSGTAEAGLQRAQSLGATAILERGSSHIEYQRELLLSESKRTGIEIPIPPNKVIEKEKREYEEADVIMVPSKFVERSFGGSEVESSKVARVPFGVDTSDFRPIEKKDDVFRVIFAGQMILRKGVHYLLEAFSDLNLPDAELWLIGSKKKEIHKYFEKYSDHFHFLGHKPQSELYKYYSQGSVFAMCSIEEGLAMVQPQAMACGLPLICTPNTGGEDLIREGEEGFVVPIRDVEALKEKILWCYEHRDECREMGRKAKSRVQESFRWRDYGDRIVEMYSDLMSKRKK